LKRSLSLIEVCTAGHVVCVIKAAEVAKHPDLEYGWIFEGRQAQQSLHEEENVLVDIIPFVASGMIRHYEHI